MDQLDQLDKLIQLYKNAKAAHESSLVLLDDEQETQNNWFKCVTKHSMDFILHIKQWLAQTKHLTTDLTTTAETKITPISLDKVPVELNKQIPVKNFSWINMPWRNRRSS